MSAINLYGIKGQLTAAVSAVSTALPVDATLAGIVNAGVVPPNVTYFSLTAGSYYELVKVTNNFGNNLVVERGFGGTMPQSFPAGTVVAFQVTEEGILENIGTVSTAIVLNGSGAADVSSPGLNNWNINVPQVSLAVDAPLELLDGYPNFRVALSPTDCCGTATSGTGGGITEIDGNGLVTASVDAEGVATVTVQPPAFSGSGITITGTWPNISFSIPAGGGGTVTSVSAGAGITVTGSPSVNPTVAITNSGVAAGNYGGVVINSRGQITAVPATLNPVSVVSVSAPITVSRLDDAVTIGITDGAIGVKGAVAFADETDPFNPADNANAATPAVVAAALATLTFPSAAANDSFTGESDASYTNAISGTTTPVTLEAGQKALVIAHVTMLDGTTPTDPVSFGMAIFNAAPVKIRANKIIPQCSQHISFVLEGPVSTALTVSTTAVPGTASVISYGMAIVTL